MTSPNLFRLIAYAVALVVVAAILACGDDPCGVDKPDLPRGTPEEVISSLAKSFEQRRVDWYAECLDEAFRFVPTEEDADSLYLPEEARWLDMADDTAAVSRMFRAESVKDVSFSFVEIADPIDGAEEGTRHLRTIPDIRVETRCPGSSGLYYLVGESLLDFVVALDPGNDGRWVIRSMTEVPMNPGLLDLSGFYRSIGDVSLATQPSTLGYLKSIFLRSPTTERTADEVLEHYAAAIATKDIGLYADCLDYSHRFIFTDDVADSLGMPREEPWWNKAQDLETMTCMFTDPAVKAIRFDCIDWSRDTSWVGGRKVIDVRVLPDIIVTYHPSGGEPLNFMVTDSFLDFRLVKRGVCGDCWTVLSAEEVPMFPGRRNTADPLSTSESSSWGQIKAFFVP